MKTIGNQAAFSRVVKHLLTQRRKSRAADGACMYRGDQGVKCAIGALIHDKHYSPVLEHSSIREGDRAKAVLRAVRRSGVKAHISLLMELQSVHDEIDPCGWEGQLKRIGDSFGLKMPKVTSSNG